MELKNNLANLVKVKTLVTMIVIIVFAVLALRGDITSDNVLVVVTTVISFYFGTQHEKKAAAGDVKVEVSTEEGE